MIDTQLLKGVLEGCVLKIISKNETYGYEILSELSKSGFDEILDGTLYPVLTRLEKNKYVKCRKAKSPYGPIRKYYTITKQGENYLLEFIESFNNITNVARKIIEEEE